MIFETFVVFVRAIFVLYQNEKVTLKRANLGGTMAVGCSHVAPLVGYAKFASNVVVSLVLNRLYKIDTDVSPC